MTAQLTSITDGTSAARELAPGRYRHYKGSFYEVLGVAHHTETEEASVVYRSLPPSPYPPTLRIRPMDMFLETVAVDGRSRPRFERID
jgi:hypothetical protein